MCFRKQFISKMWPIQLTFLLFLVGLCRVCFFPRHSNTSSFLTRSAWMIFSILLQHHISTLSKYFWSTFPSFKVFVIYFPKFPGICDLLSEVYKFQHHTMLSTKCCTTLVCCSNLSPVCWWKDSSCLKAIFAMVILDLVSYVHLVLFVIVLPK